MSVARIGGTSVVTAVTCAASAAAVGGVLTTTHAASVARTGGSIAESTARTAATRDATGVGVATIVDGVRG